MPSPPAGSIALEEFDFFKPFFRTAGSKTLDAASSKGVATGTGLPVGFAWTSPSSPARYNMFLRRTEDAYNRALNSTSA